MKKRVKIRSYRGQREGRTIKSFNLPITTAMAARSEAAKRGISFSKFMVEALEIFLARAEFAKSNQSEAK